MADEAAVARVSGTLEIFRPRREYVLPYWFLLAPCLYIIYIFASSACPRIHSKTTCFEVDPLAYVGYALGCAVVCYPLAIALYVIFPVEKYIDHSRHALALFAPSRRTIAALLLLIGFYVAALLIDAIPSSVPEWLSTAAFGAVVVLRAPFYLPVYLYNGLFEPASLVNTYSDVFVNTYADIFANPFISLLFIPFIGAWHVLLAVALDRLVGEVEERS